MDPQQFKQEFLPKEIVLKIYRDIPATDYKTRIATLQKSAEQVRPNYDADVFEIKLNNNIGFFYYQAEEYTLGIQHLKKVMKIMQPGDYPSIYFSVLGLLIRCNRLIINYDEAFFWFDKAIDSIENVDSSFTKLNLLKDYVDLVLDSNQSFNDDYKIIIQSIINDLGFPEKLNDPIVTLQSMLERHRIWNRKLSEITIIDSDKRPLILSKMEEYHQNCEIQWYKDYAAERIAELKAKI